MDRWLASPLPKRKHLLHRRHPRNPLAVRGVMYRASLEWVLPGLDGLAVKILCLRQLPLPRL